MRRIVKDFLLKVLAKECHSFGILYAAWPQEKRTQIENLHSLFTAGDLFHA